MRRTATLPPENDFRTDGKQRYSGWPVRGRRGVRGAQRAAHASQRLVPDPTGGPVSQARRCTSRRPTSATPRPRRIRTSRSRRSARRRLPTLARDGNGEGDGPPTDHGRQYSCRHCPRVVRGPKCQRSRHAASPESVAAAVTLSPRGRCREVRSISPLLLDARKGAQRATRTKRVYKGARGSLPKGDARQRSAAS